MDVAAMTVDKIRQALQGRGLSTNGLKKDLVERLQAALAVRVVREHVAAGSCFVCNNMIALNFEI